jgi:Ca2+-binding RTX toxin-like protein
MIRAARALAIAGGVALLALLVLSFTASNIVPASSVGQRQQAITAQDLAPSQCAGMGLTTVVTNLSGTSGNDLVLGTASAETLNGNAGNDCLLGGGGNDTLRGGTGTDVCIGGPGTDSFNGCETQIQ